MEDALAHLWRGAAADPAGGVLILVLMEDALAPSGKSFYVTDFIQS